MGVDKLTDKSIIAGTERNGTERNGTERNGTERNGSRILHGDSVEMLKTIPDGTVDCCVTSPPYYGLRDYGTATWVGGDPSCPHYRTSKKSDKTATGHKNMMETGHAVGDAIYKTVCPICGAVRVDNQIGLEETPDEYIDRLVTVFREVKRVLRDDGTLWLNIGDSYCGTGDKGNYKDPKNPEGRNGQAVAKNKRIDGIKSKDMIGIPWMLAFALRDDGWYLRQDIIWHKPNPMPESVRDRCTKSHEYIFLFSKKPKYYFDSDAIRENAKPDNSVRDRDHTKLNNTPGRTRMGGLKTNHYTKRNKRDVWKVATRPYKEAHFATFPEQLIEPCILAGSRPDGIVLDPFFGSGTTGVVAEKYGRRYIGVELNEEYIELAKKRLDGVQMTLPIVGV